MEKKKRDLEEIEEFEEIDEFDEFEDEDLEDEILDEEDFVEDEKPAKKSKKAAKKAAKAGKKKLSKGAKAGITVGSILGVVAIALVFVLVVLPMLVPAQIAAENTSLILAKGGYQKYVDATKLELRSDASFDKIYSVDEMLSAEGLSLSNKADTKQIASNIFNLAVTNYANLKSTSWYCYTDSSVYATDVDASLGIKLHFEDFNVGVRAAYYISSVESSNPKNQGRANEFSSTISGVTKLDIAGLPANLTDTVKKLFGFNIQNCLYEGTFAYRRGPNGGAAFYGDDDDLGFKYPMGAWNEKLPTKTKTVLQNDGARGIGHFSMAEYNPETDDVSQKLDYIDTPANIIATRSTPWSPLNTYYNYAYKLDCFGEYDNYYTGNYGAGWAPYNFEIANLSDETTVTYDSKTHVYTIEMVVKADKADEACLFAKGSLTKDTKDYIKMANAKYKLEKNTIEVFDNGLIKSWARQETISTDQPAELVILSGTCHGGGGTTNVTQSAFSYEKQDCDPLAQAALYWPQLGDKAVVGNVAYDLKGYTTFDEYNPDRAQNKK